MTPDEALGFAVRAALQATCRKSRRGVVLFRREDAQIVSSGFNGPPPGFVCTGSEACRGACNKIAIHAEDRAIRVASWHARGTDLLHVKVVDELPVASGGPSCWQCSRTVVDARTGSRGTRQGRLEGRHVYAGCLKAYFEQLGWEITPHNVAAHSGYVQNAIIRPPSP